ncbi:SbtR family transcriptional regulator [Pseudonocardia sp. P1]|uniref:SbtR family transcriptional regulator n=1 Tax=Pseudonocardia sp. P1 TaxID=761194 RepID=UPI003FD64A4C
MHDIDGAGSGPLLQRAVRDGAGPADVGVGDLIALAVAMVLATDHRAEPPAQAGQLLAVAVVGLSPAR